MTRERLPERRLIDAVAYPMLQLRPPAAGTASMREPRLASDRRAQQLLKREMRSTAPAY
jgi:hypothetical protein